MPIAVLSDDEVNALVEEKLSRLLFLEPIVRLIRAVYATNYISNAEHAVSLGLITKPGRGKSEVLSLFGISSSKFKVINDVSAYSLEKKLLPDIQRGTINAIAISDLTVALEKAEAARKSFINLLLSLTEEGLWYKQSYVSDVNVSKPIRCQVLFGITPRKFDGVVRSWSDSGFSRRMLWSSWDYTDEQISKIEDAKIQQPTVKMKIHKIPILGGSSNKKYSVEIMSVLNDPIKALAKRIMGEVNF